MRKEQLASRRGDISSSPSRHFSYSGWFFLTLRRVALLLCSDFSSNHISTCRRNLDPPPTSVALSLQLQRMWKSQNEAVRMFSTPARPRTKLNTSNVPPAPDKKIHSRCLPLNSLGYLSRQSGDQQCLEPRGRRIRRRDCLSKVLNSIPDSVEILLLGVLGGHVPKGLSIRRDIKQCSWLRVINEYPLVPMWIAKRVTSVS